MSKTAHKRINITLPESTVAMLESLAGKGSRSTFINEAIKERAKKLKQQNLRELLKEGAIVHRERDLAIAREWFHLEEELWEG
ncbi:MAG: hypothetical protein WBD22_00300 [Pyrinomonadaceae bacterium]